MAKTTGQARGERDSGVSISFVGGIIDRAIKELEVNLETLPRGASAARRVVKSAIAGLTLIKATTKLHCGPRWFMSPE